MDDLVLSCDGCVMVRTHYCEDCLVTALCAAGPSSGGTLDTPMLRAVSALQNADLLPPLRRKVALS
jgi:hypothetical protein